MNHNLPATNGNNGRSPEEKRAVLKARAIALAREPETKETQSAFLEVVEFCLATERFAIEISYVREVYPFRSLTPLPCTPDYILGIVNVRGRILSIIDIRKFFDLPYSGFTDLHKIIIVQASDVEVGILADVVVGVQAIPLNRLQSSLPSLTGVRERYLKGVTGDHLLILDTRKILMDEEIVVHEEV